MMTRLWLVATLLLTIGAAKIEGSGSQEITTPDEYKYQPVLDLAGVSTVTFTVRACNDAHITLQPTVGTITRYSAN